MLPHSYELPAAILLVLSGALSCFAGYRLFKIILGIYGFIAGALFASSMMGVTNTTGMIVGAVVGGLAGAVLMMLAYFVGTAIIGAGLGALIAHAGWGYVRAGDPPATAVVVLAIAGAIAAMFLRRYVIIVATAFAGADMVIMGGLAVAGERSAAAKAASATDVWILYPTSPAPGQAWVPIAWVLLGLIGTGVQLGITGRKRT